MQVRFRAFLTSRIRNRSFSMDPAPMLCGIIRIHHYRIIKKNIHIFYYLSYNYKIIFMVVKTLRISFFEFSKGRIRIHGKKLHDSAGLTMNYGVPQTFIYIFGSYSTWCCICALFSWFWVTPPLSGVTFRYFGSWLDNIALYRYLVFIIF